MSILLQINNLEMAYGTQTILNGANLTISDHQKVAVVGRNGAGKSTLFRLIVGEEEPTGGEIRIHSNTQIGYLTQHSPFEPGETVMDFLTRTSGQESWVCAKVAAQFQIKNDLFDREVTSLAGGYQMRSFFLPTPEMSVRRRTSIGLDQCPQVKPRNHREKSQPAQGDFS
jgi:ATP-binding cassette subfamily F protein 3